MSVSEDTDRENSGVAALTACAGVLYVVATPIGNLADLSTRARAILATVDLIACEDTRHSRRLLAHFGIATALCAYHEHNEAEMTPRLLERLATGQALALIGDAGTPLISDPGFFLVRAARARGLPVSPIPGPCAPICALSAAGLPTDRFTFLGFVPRTAVQRRAWAESLRTVPGTLLCHDSGQRIVATLEALAAALGPTRPAVIARELTKRFETFLHGSLAELAARIAADPDQRRGELVLLVAGATTSAPEASDPEARRVLALLAAELPAHQAARLAAAIVGGRRNEWYRAALALRGTASED